MEKTINLSDTKEVKFNDNIEVTFFGDDIESTIYNITYNSNEGFGLKSEEDGFVKHLIIDDTRLMLYYPDGNTVTKDKKVRTIKVNDQRFKKNAIYPVEGRLLLYNGKMAQLYNLDSEAAIFESKFVNPDLNKKKISR